MIKQFWVMYGNVKEHPVFLKYDYRIGLEVYSDLYKTKEGHAVLLIPLMRLTGNDTGSQEVYNHLVYAWNQLGLRNDANVLMITCYHSLPEYVKIDGKRYFPKETGTTYLYGDEEAVVENDKVVIKAHPHAKKSPLGIALVSAERKRGGPVTRVFVEDRRTLARIYELTTS